MAMNLPDWFPEKWADEVTLRAQQMNPKVAASIDDGGLFVGDRVDFPRIGQVDVIDGAREQDLAALTALLDWIDVAAKPKFLPIKIWDPDKNKLTIPIVANFAKVITAGMSRARDAVVINAMADAVTNGVQGVKGRSAEAGTPAAAEQITTIGDYNTVADLDTISEAISILGTNYEVEGEKISLALPFKLKTNIWLDPYMAKTDTKNDLPWSDINWITYEKLKGNGADGFAASGTGADLYLYAGSSTVSAYNDGIKEINERLGASLSDMIGQWFQGGAAVKEPLGIVRIKTKMDFTLARKPIPVVGL